MLLVSHALSVRTPTFAGAESVVLEQISDICCGDLCNSMRIKLPNHCGTHVDVPKHFVRGGASITDFEPQDWWFENVRVLDLPLERSSRRHLDEADLPALEKDLTVTAVLLRTGWEKKRFTRDYTHDSPGLTPGLLHALDRHFPNLRAIGMDFISACRFGEEGPGIDAHRAFLSKPRHLLIEDMALAHLRRTNFDRMLVAPLLIEGGDGAPATVFVW